MESQTEVKLIQFFDEHFYQIKIHEFSHWIASVTTKLSVEDKPFIGRWRGDIGNREADMRMNEAGQRGKRIHFAWWVFITGGTVLYNPWERPNYTEQEIEKLKSEGIVFVLNSQDEMLQLWKLQRFFQIVNPKILHAELIVYSIKNDIAGTMDNAFFIEKGTYDVSGRQKLMIPKSGIYVADLKTGKSFDEAMWNQIAPYAKCYEEMGHGKVDGGIIIHTGASTKSGIVGLSIPLRTAEELEHDFIIYQKISDIWKERHPTYGPDIFQFPSMIKKEIKK